jgi:hypothetical protein
MAHGNRQEINHQEIYLKVFSASTKTLNNLSESIEHLTPQKTDLYRVQLASLYGLLSDEVARLEKLRPLAWLELKVKDFEGNPWPKPLSDKSTDTHYDTTENGQRRLELKFRLKAIEKMLSALAGHLRRFSEEARNEF